MLDLTGHEKHTIAPTAWRKLGWSGRLWRATCECGYVSKPYRHPIDASTEVTYEHVVKEARRLTTP